ncbi:MAG: hypothetical protein LC748_15135, partial [Thermomicrobia bacterium]|nr:hypothetical protein [Thermomicrobia bacterium]
MIETEPVPCARNKPAVLLFRVSMETTKDIIETEIGKAAKEIVLRRMGASVPCRCAEGNDAPVCGFSEGNVEVTAHDTMALRCTRQPMIETIERLKFDFDQCRVALVIVWYIR